MKVFMIAMLALSTVFGAEVITLQKKHADFNTSYYMTFEVNPEMGRAWVNINSYDNMMERDEDKPVKVEGLYYKDGEVIYEKDGEMTLCAYSRTVGRWVFRHQVVRKTGNCVFEEVTRRESHDDGFRVRTRRMTYLNLVIH